MPLRAHQPDRDERRQHVAADPRRLRATLSLCPCGAAGWWTRDGVTRCAGCERVLLVTWAARAEEAT